MPIFFHDIVLPHDPPGFSIWLQEHYLEHRQFVQLFQGKTPIVYIPDYNFALWSDDKPVMTSWLEAHQATHEQLRLQTGVSGIDLADVDLTQYDQWFSWMDSHADEHSLIRASLGLTL